MDILRIATAGSVDDGKSTLIGRMLYETNSVPKDKLLAIEAASKRRGVNFLDLSLLTDGLIAEREQGITIDVAHVYFSTPKRKYIVADSPGHVEYTRNMVTGASTASVSIILIDARNGVVEQTRRHYAIAAMLRVPRVIICLNKMDLVDYDQTKFEAICAEFLMVAGKLRPSEQQLTFVPVSSLHGENITVNHGTMPWYNGPPLLTLLEEADAHVARLVPARMQVQHVIRPRTPELHDFRGYAGRISGGRLAVGDTIVALPANRQSTITQMQRFGVDVDLGEAGESVVLQLSDDIDISRGAMISRVAGAPVGSKELKATVCWMDHEALRQGSTYILQHGVARVRAKVTVLSNRLNVTTQNTEPDPGELKLNEIGAIQLRLSQPVFVDSYRDNSHNGAFILINENTHGTVGVGFVDSFVRMT